MWNPPYYGSDSYLYQRLGMCLSISPAIWQKFIQRVIKEIPNYRKNHLAIMDDILTHSKRIDHIGHLIDLFKAIIRNGLKISPRKCKLFKKALVFMGITIMIEDGMPKMKLLKSRIDTVLKVKPPKTVKEMQIILWNGKLYVNLFTKPAGEGNPNVFHYKKRNTILLGRRATEGF